MRVSSAQPPRDGAPPGDGVPDGGLKSVLTALDLLDCFMASDELGVTDIANRLHVAKSTAHRLLTTLAARGMAEKNPETGRYRLGMHVYELGTITANRSRLRKLALPVMEDLRQRTGYTIHLSVADGADIIHLERLQSMRGIQVLVDMKRRFPVHVTSGGKAIAAFNDDVADARRRADFPVLTSHTMRRESDFDNALAEVRRRGFAVNREEAMLGFTSIAAPILDTSGVARAAISIVGPNRDIDPHFERISRLVMAAARKIGQSLPWSV
jgi:DNA-binding IclR family transcriptional regulator